MCLLPPRAPNGAWIVEIGFCSEERHFYLHPKAPSGVHTIEKTHRRTPEMGRKSTRIRLKWSLKRIRRRLGRRVVSGTRFWSSQSNFIFDVLAPFGRFLEPFWDPLDFEGVPKSMSLA